MHIYNAHKRLPKAQRKKFRKPCCESCGEIATKKNDIIMTEHHVFPKRWNWPEDVAHLAVWLCQICHAKVGSELYTLERSQGTNPNSRTKLPQWKYLFVVLEITTK